MTVSVRQARREDAALIAGFAIALFRQHREYDTRRFADVGNLEGAERFYASRAESDNAAVLVAEVDVDVVGFAYLEYEEMNYAALLRSAVWLHDIYVQQSARHTGAGRELIKAASVAAAKMGADKLMLSVAAANTVARDFFELAGFRTTMFEMMLELPAQGSEGSND